MQTLPQVLLIEDDRSIATALSQALRGSHNIEVAGTGQTALYKVDTEEFDIIVLDLNLPDMTGIMVCRQIRDRGLSVPILILSGDSGVMTKINLLDSGANDYLTKPFSLGELKARLRALLRTNQGLLKLSRQLSIGDLLLDRQTFKVTREGIEVTLRRKEFALLECLMEHAGTVVTRNALTRYAWQGNDNIWTNTVDVHIKSLRDKIDRPFGQSLIQTVHGLGYKLETVQPATALQD
ncbi:MAG: response regulator transcription factor [Patescibacteria group bacterium]